jgi:hypothetical protein
VTRRRCVCLPAGIPTTIADISSSDIDPAAITSVVQSRKAAFCFTATAFSKLAAITTYLIFPSWEDLLLTLDFAKPPPIPP